MRIGYFSSILGTPGGPAIVDKFALEAISRIDKKNEYVVYGLNDDVLTDLDVEQDANISFRVVEPGGKWLGLTIGMGLELRRRPVDLLHATYVPHLFIPCPYALTITCWSPFAEPELYPPLIRLRLRYLLTKGLKNASAIFCYTQFLKERVIDEFGVPGERIFITKPGVTKEFKVIPQDVTNDYLASIGLSRPFILFVGVLAKRKNVDRLIRAYDLVLKEKKIEQKLVLVGEKGYFFEEIEKLIIQLGLEEQVILVGRKPFNELIYFYNAADLFVFPTLSEGFGMPPVEAMACGTPVIASNITCVPEVVGEGAYFIDPYDIEDMANAIDKCLHNHELRNRMVKKGLVWSSNLTWEHTAKQYVQAYEKIREVGW